MPEMDGYRTLAAIRDVPATATIPFILMTGSLPRAEFRETMVRGADDYLMKPFSARELIATVSSLFAYQSQMQSKVHHQIETSCEQPRPRFSKQSVSARTPLAVTA